MFEKSNTLTIRFEVHQEPAIDGIGTAGREEKVLRIFGKRDRRDSIAEFLEAAVHRWIRGVNGRPGGGSVRPMEARHVPEPVRHSNLLVVGDYLFDSTINGVLDSAEYTANWLAAEMGQS